MATQTTDIAGSGYGNPYIDALISGAGWANTGVPIRYAFASGPVSAADSPSGVAYDAPAWSEAHSEWGLEKAFNTIQAVCGVTFTRVWPAGAEADLRWWMMPAGWSGQDVPGVGNGVLDGFFSSIAWSSWDTQVTSVGSPAFSMALRHLGYALGLANPETGGTEADRNAFPGATDPDYAPFGVDGLNQGVWTMMSANPGWVELLPGQEVWNSLNRGWQATPMAFDVAALQRIYGANMTTRTGSDWYQIGSTSAGWVCIWDAGGNDTITASGVESNVIIDLRAAPLTGPNAAGHVSRVLGVAAGYTIANGVLIEGALGGDGNDTLIGNDANNRLEGAKGNDTLDGGAGVDTASFTGSLAEYAFAVQDGRIIVRHVSPTSDWYSTGVDILSNVELLQFTNSPAVSLVNFNPVHYLARNLDLYAAWGLNTDMALQHYLTNGRLENRPTRFEPLAYVASYADLMAAIGTNADAAIQHYLNHGAPEGRRVLFDATRYLASHPDLLRAFGSDTERAAAHYITDGRAEGRGLTFAGMSYIASYGDLRAAFGTNAALATQHYVTNGFAEGRRITFDAERYLASYTDLLDAFGADTYLAAQHYITNGRAEGRRGTFDALHYLASHEDLIVAFGQDTALATRHYITNGYKEGRGLTFDAAFYLAKHHDLGATYGFSAYSAYLHYVSTGFQEGRVVSNAGDDVLIGSFGEDTLNAGPGNDRLTGAQGADRLTGGSGADTFVYGSVDDLNIASLAWAERITDFTPGTDKIDLSAIDANADTPGDDAFTALLGHLAAFTAPGQMRLDNDPTHGYILWGNVDADIEAEFAIVLTGWPAINFATDIIA